MHKLFILIKIFFRRSSNLYFGYIDGHWRVSDKKIKEIEKELFKRDVKTDYVEKFEKDFSKFIGEGNSVAFASGRMSFYSLLKALHISENDEVVLLGYTCSVMVNAVLRTGAKVVYSDIDINTFGSCVESIEKVITLKTKVIVAQHSFGIPCEIEKIKLLAKDKNIFLLEDCAISFDSKVNGKNVGDFGDASLFSTDHSKPINTFTGGLIYSRNSKLIKKLKSIQSDSSELPINKQISIFKQLLLERKYSNSNNYILLMRINILNRILKRSSPFLDKDYGFEINHESDYSYPSKLPSFLAMVGIEQLKNWATTREDRKKIFKEILSLITNTTIAQFLPNAYFDSNLDIVPLRFVWAAPNGASVRDKLSDFLHVEWTWFLSPIVVTTGSLDCYGYKKGMSPNSELVGDRMVNIPCNLSCKETNLLLQKIKFVLN
jgi:dTDP-4-amino-4,6-dideoxygalactose transaminase